MHEMSLAEGVIKICEDHAASQGFERVKTIFLEIGKLSHVEVESLRFCLEAVKRDSVAETATIQIDEIPGEGWCLNCSARVAVAALYEECPHCGSFQVQVTGGNEMRVKELEVE